MRLLIVDGNWYLWRCFYTAEAVHRPLEQIIPHKLLGMICKDALAIKAERVLVAFDGPKVFRYKIFHAYKSSRAGRSGSIDVDGENSNAVAADAYAYLPHVQSLFALVGLPIFQPRHREADDVLRSCAHAYGREHDVVCGTQDKDNYQSLAEAVLYDSSAKGPDKKPRPKYIRRQEVERKFGITVEQMVDYQTLIGDRGDDIPPIKDMDKGRAKKVLNEFGSIRGWYKNGGPEVRRFLTTQQSKLARNRKLVELTLDAVPPEDPKEWRLRKEKPNDPELSRTFHDYHSFQWPKSRGLFSRIR